MSWWNPISWFEVPAPIVPPPTIVSTQPQLTIPAPTIIVPLQQTPLSPSPTTPAPFPSTTTPTPFFQQPQEKPPSDINAIVSTPYAQQQIQQGMNANRIIHDMQIAQIQAQTNAPIQKAQYAEKWFNELPFLQKALISVNTEMVHFADRPAEIILGGFNPKNITPFSTLAYDTQTQMTANEKQYGYLSGFGATLLQNQAVQITAIGGLTGAGLGLVSQIPKVGAPIATIGGIGAAGAGIFDIGKKFSQGDIRRALTETLIFGASAPFVGAGFTGIGGRFVKLPSAESLLNFNAKPEIITPEGLLPGKAIKFQAGAELALDLGKMNPPISRPLDFTKVKALGDFGKEVESWIRLNPEQKPVIGGSAAAWTQFKSARLPGDIDIDVLNPKLAAELLFPKAQSFFGAENVKLDVSNQFSQATIKIYGRHGVQFISKTPVGAEIGQHTGLPFESGEPINIEGIKYKPAFELLERKADSILRQQGEIIAPQSHRMKDIIDFEKMSSEFINVKKSEAESAWWRKQSKAEKAALLETKLETYKLHSGLDVYPTLEVYSRHLVKNPDLIPGLFFPGLYPPLTKGKDYNFINTAYTPNKELTAASSSIYQSYKSSANKPTDTGYTNYPQPEKPQTNYPNIPQIKIPYAPSNARPYIPSYDIPHKLPSYDTPYKSSYDIPHITTEPSYHPPYISTYTPDIKSPEVPQIEFPKFGFEDDGDERKFKRRKVKSYIVKNIFTTLEDIVGTIDFSYPKQTKKKRTSNKKIQKKIRK